MPYLAPVQDVIHSKTASGPEATLSVTTTPDGVLEVHSVIPDGISIGTGQFGRCLIATKHFPKGSVMYRAYGALVKTPAPTDDECPSLCSETEAEDDSLTSTSYSESSCHHGTEYLLHLYSEKDGKLLESVVLDEINSVKDNVDPTVRQVYGFDGFMNHSCSPNCYCPLMHRTQDLMYYDTIAEKDIQIGDEITCDYALFDYECDGHEIVECGCKSASCRGKMLGFKGLTLEEKVRIMHQCEEDVLDKFFQDNPNVVLLSGSVPKGVSLRHSRSGSSLVASRKFVAGEVVYTNQATLIDKEDLVDKTFIIKIDNRYFLLDQAEHFIHRPNYVEHLGFDSFQDHSCEPNTSQLYENSTTYTVRACRTILPGESLTIDYGQLENQADHVEHIPSSTFTCQCGSAKCRGTIAA